MPPARAGSTSTPSWIARHTQSLADLRALQDWYLRYQLETVPGVAEVASIGGFVRQYQVNLDPNKLFSYGISASTVIDKVRQSTNEVGGDVLEMSGAEYMIRGLGYLHIALRSRKCSCRDQEWHARAGAGSWHGFIWA